MKYLAIIALSAALLVPTTSRAQVPGQVNPNSYAPNMYNRAA